MFLRARAKMLLIRSEMGAPRKDNAPSVAGFGTEILYSGFEGYELLGLEMRRFRRRENKWWEMDLLNHLPEMF